MTLMDENQTIAAVSAGSQPHHSISTALSAGPKDRPAYDPLPIQQGVCWAIGAIAAFHMAYAFPGLSILVMGYILGLAQLTRLRTARQAAGLGFLVGLLTAAPQLSC